MTDYQAPYNELLFVLNRLLEVGQLNNIESFSDVNQELIEAVVDEAGKFAAEVLAPTNRLGDLAGNQVKQGSVITPSEIKQAYRQFVDNGWLSLAQPTQYGGQGLPFTVHMAASECWNSANLSLALCPMLTAGAIDAIAAHASDELKNTYLPKLISGQWTGTMNLTEPHAGSDLSNLKAKAIPQGDHYLIKGQKIYITWGDHDMTDNIIHIVLAPIEGAQSGVKGLSLFLVPKYTLNDEGGIGEKNDVNVVSVEHKLGINASPTCVMSFGESSGAVGYLIGEPGQGLACMFTLMNHARLEVGLEGVALSERAYQDAVAYAKQRVQGRHPQTGESTNIIEHADVQRMLMQMKSMTDAMRAMCYDAALSHDLRTHTDSPKIKTYQQTRFALLTPVVKAWCTELVNEVTSLGIQVHGGMGYIEETGVAQHYRDARITSIYEGTNGIQANDLVARKLLKDKGAGFHAFISEVTASIGSIHIETLSEQLGTAIEDLQQSAQFILENAAQHPKFVGAVAYSFLMQMGYVCGAWYHLRTAHLCQKQNDPFTTTKYKSAKFYFAQLLPRAQSYQHAILLGHKIGNELEADDF